MLARRYQLFLFFYPSEVELVMEFRPQQVFYFGLAITGSTPLFSVVFPLKPCRKLISNTAGTCKTSNTKCISSL